MIPIAPPIGIDHFTRPALRREQVREAADGSWMVFLDLGRSEEGRPIQGVRLGHGPRNVFLMAGAHADEPVGPETLFRLIRCAASDRGALERLAQEFSIVIVPQVNPDGEAVNRGWIDRWPDFGAYLTQKVRELPGRDIEFGFPEMRQENRAVSRAMRTAAPLALHMSLHGMGFSDGGMLLIDRYWGYRADLLRTGFADAVREHGLRLHDHNRKGEKGFFQIEPGFTTTPEGAAMRAFFESRGEPEIAAQFGDSSMEYARSLGGDPLCVVTELPLFLVEGPREPGIPRGYLDFRDSVPGLRLRLSSGESAESVLDGLPVKPLTLETAMALQWQAIFLSLDQVLRRG